MPTTLLSTIRNLVTLYWRYALGAVLVLLVGYYFFGGGSNPALNTYTVTRGDFKATVDVTGTVVAAQDVDLGFADSGRVGGVYTRVGDKVGAGKVLAALENGDDVAQVAQREAELARAEAELASLRAGTRPEEVALRTSAVVKAEAQLRDAVRSAYVSADDAVRKQADQFFNNPRSSLATITFTIPDAVLKSRLEQERIALEPVFLNWATSLGSESFATGAPEPYAVSARKNLSLVATFLADASSVLSLNTSMATLYQDDINAARTTIAADLSTLSTAEGVLEAARGDLSLAKAGATAPDIAAKEAAVRAAVATLASARAALAKTLIVAPFSGIVSKMDIEPGEFVSSNTSKVTLISAGAFQIETFVPQLSVASVVPEDAATVTLDAYGPALTFTARVLSVDPAETIRDGVATYKTMLAFETTDTRVRSGMTANVTITTGLWPNAIIVPVGTVLHDAGNTYVRLASGLRKEVIVGESVSLGRVRISEGLEDGDVILLTP